MTEWSSLGVLLLAVAYSWVPLTSAQDQFHLTLVPSSADCQNEAVNSDSELLDVTLPIMEGGSGANLMEDEEEEGNGTCVFSAAEVRVECSCGERLQNTRRKYEEMVMRTCDRYDQLNDSSSPLGICERSLRDLQPGYKVCSTSTFASAQATNYFFTNASLAKKVQEIEDRVAQFRVILDRTITGVLVATNFSKCLCMDRYKKWLCATQLPIFFPSNSSDFDPCTDTSNTTSLTRLKPSVRVCHDVLQSCPYYTPSRYQIQRPQQGGKEEFKEVVYGGYPAFDCPRESFVNQQSSYSFSCKENCSMCFENATRSGGHASYSSSSTMVTMISILLFILLIRTIN